MQVKKSGGRVFGAQLTADERKAIDIEVHREFSNVAEKHRRELSAKILWVLNEQFGFGPERLWRFFAAFDGLLEELVARYEMYEGQEDMLWLCQYKLKEKYGIDIEEWERRLRNNEEKA